MRPFFENVVDAIRASAAERGASVRQARWQTRAVLAQQRARRQAAVQSMRWALRKNRAAVIESVKAALAPVVAAPAASPTRPGTDAHQGPPPRRSVWDFLSEPAHERPVDEARQQLERQVLEYIVSHPNGVRALDIGNRLGVDWRRVLAVAHTLVEGGVVDQVNDEFYPAGKVSGSW
jgi:hypothetical protein